MIVAIRLSAVATAALIVILVGRLLAALPPAVGFVLAILASLAWAYRFERGD